MPPLAMSAPMPSATVKIVPTHRMIASVRSCVSSQSSAALLSTSPDARFAWVMPRSSQTSSMTGPSLFTWMSSSWTLRYASSIASRASAMPERIMLSTAASGSASAIFEVSRAATAG